MTDRLGALCLGFAAGWVAGALTVFALFWREIGW